MNSFFERFGHPEKYYKSLFKWGILGVVMGIIGGLLGAGFHHTLHAVTHFRETHTWMIFLLPVGGLLIVGIYRLFRMRNNRGTNEIIEAI